MILRGLGAPSEANDSPVGPGWPPVGASGPSLRPLGPMTKFLVQESALRAPSCVQVRLPPRRDSHAHAGCPLLPSRCVLPGSEPRGGTLFRRVQRGRAPQCGPRPGGFSKIALFAAKRSDTAYSGSQLAEGLASIDKVDVRLSTSDQDFVDQPTGQSLPTPFGGLIGRCCSTGRYSRPRISRRGRA